MGWPTGFEPATTSSTSLDSTVELRPPTGLERLVFQVPYVKFTTVVVVGCFGGARLQTSRLASTLAPPKGVKCATTEVGYGKKIWWGKRRRVTMLIGSGLYHADDPGQFHLAERAPPSALPVPKGQTPECFALNQHYLTRRRRQVVRVDNGGFQKREGHPQSINLGATIVLPDFVKDSTTLGMAVLSRSRFQVLLKPQGRGRTPLFDSLSPPERGLGPGRRD